MGEVAGDHRGAFPLHITAIPEEAVVVDGDHVTVEGDLDGLVGGQPRALASEQAVGLGFETVVGDQGGGGGVDVLHGDPPCCSGSCPFVDTIIAQPGRFVKGFFGVVKVFFHRPEGLVGISPPA